MVKFALAIFAIKAVGLVVPFVRPFVNTSFDSFVFNSLTFWFNFSSLSTSELLNSSPLGFTICCCFLIICLAEVLVAVIADAAC